MKKANNKKCVAVLSSAALGILIASALTTNAHAAVTGYVENDAADATRVISFDGTNLEKSYTQKMLGKAAPMFDAYLKDTPVAFQDNKTGLVKYQSVIDAYTKALAAGDTKFTVDGYTENASGSDLAKDVIVGYTMDANGVVSPVKAVDTKALTDAITADTAEAKAAVVGTAVGNYAQADIDTYNAAIAAAQKVADNKDAAQADVDAAVKTLATAKTTFESKAVKVVVDTKALTDAIAADTAEAKAAVVGTAVGNYAQADIDTYNAAIAAAQKVADNKDAVQADVDEAVKTLATAKTTFESKAVKALAVQSVSAINDSQVKVTFNKAVDATAGAAKANYSIVDDVNGTVQIDNVKLADDKLSAVITVGNGSVPAALSTTKTYTVKLLNDISLSTAPAYTTPVSSSTFTMSDVTLPAVSNVTAYGNKKAIVTFNKPVLLNAAKASNFAVLNADGKTYTAGQGFNAASGTGDDLTANYVAGSGYTQVEVDFASTIPVGNYTLKTYGGTSDARDAQGLNLIESNSTFSVSQAATVAQATGLTVVNRNTVDVTFDSAVANPAATTLTWATGKIADSVALKGENTLEYTFTTNIIPTGAQTFTLAGVKDAYGNTVPTKTFATTVASDSVATAAVTSTATGAIKVTYSKDMLHDASTYAADNAANYVVKDSTGTVIPASVSYNNVNSTYVATLTGTFPAGNYTVSVTGVKDLVGQSMTDVSNSAVKVPDTVAPSAAAVKVSGVTGNKFVVTYDKAMSVTGSTSITNASNYQYSGDGTTTYTDLPAGTSLVASSDGKSVTITLPANATYTAGTSKIQLGKLAASTVNVVADAAGNLLDKLPGDTATKITIVAESASAPTILSQATAITGADTIRVALDGTKAALASVDKADFVYSIDGTTPSVAPVDAQLVTVDGVQYIDITTDSDHIMSAATPAGNVKVATVATPVNSKTALGTVIAGSALATPAAKTSFAASLASVEVKDANHVEVYLNGVATTLTDTDFKLYQNGAIAGGSLSSAKVGDTKTGSVFEITTTTPIDPDAAVTLKTVAQDSIATTDQNSKALTANTTGVTGSIKLMANSLSTNTTASAAVVTGNTITIVFNRALDPTTVLAGWDGSSTTIDAKFNHTAGTLTINGIGTIAGYTGTADDDFATTTAVYTSSSHTLVITLGDASTIHATAPAAHGLTFTANSALKSTAGTSVSTSLITLN